MGFVRVLERRSNWWAFCNGQLRKRDGGGGFIVRDENARAISCL